jgi:hypothetical protein
MGCLSFERCDCKGIEEFLVRWAIAANEGQDEGQTERVCGTKN